MCHELTRRDLPRMWIVLQIGAEGNIQIDTARLDELHDGERRELL